MPIEAKAHLLREIFQYGTGSDMIKKMACSFVLSVVFLSGASGEDLCTEQRKPLPQGVDELKMEEGLFTIEEALGSLPYLESKVIRMMQEHEATRDVLWSEHFYITYPNSLNILKGTILRQNAYICRQKLEIAKLQQADPGALGNAQRDFEKAKKAFCDFLKEAEYVD